MDLKLQAKLQISVTQSGTTLLLLEEEASTARDEKDVALRRVDELSLENDALKKENASLKLQLMQSTTVTAPAIETVAVTPVTLTAKRLGNYIVFHIKMQI
jgi:hypothetical protein